MALTYYLWRDEKGRYYVSDYKEINNQGLVHIDGYGYIKAILIYQNPVKEKCWAYMQRDFF